MLKFTKPYGWASCVACLALVVATSGAMAEEDKDQAQRYEAQRQSSDEDSQRQDQDRQRNQQNQQRSQQDQQRNQQDQQRFQQDQQRTQQSRQRDQQQWDERRGFPQPDRDSYGRSQNQYDSDQQWNRDQQYSRDTQRGGQSGNDAGLGVSIAQERGDQGLTVLRVHRGSPADQMGLREGDRITHINGERVQSTDQFISRVRNMDPGDQIELEVQRNQQERSFRGQLESRQEALVLRGDRGRGQQDSWQQERGSRQTGYQEQGGFAQGQRGRSGATDRQISQIERQLSQLSREIEDLRYALRDIRDQSGRSSRETTARYDEYRSRDRDEGSQMSDRTERQRQYDGSRDQRSYQDSPREFGQQSGQFGRQSGQFGQSGQGSRSNTYNEDESPGGETGEARLRPDRN